MEPIEYNNKFLEYIYSSQIVELLTSVFLVKEKNIIRWKKLNNFHPRLLLSYGILQKLWWYTINWMIKIHNECVKEWVLKSLHNNDLFNRPTYYQEDNKIKFVYPTIIWKYTNKLIQWSEDTQNNFKVTINDMVYFSEQSDVDKPLKRFLEKQEYLVYIALLILYADIKSISIDWIENIIIYKLVSYFREINNKAIVEFLKKNINIDDVENKWSLDELYSISKEWETKKKYIPKIDFDSLINAKFHWSYFYQIIKRIIISEKTLEHFSKPSFRKSFVGLFNKPTKQIS